MNVTLTNCDHEPIHIPGAIQPHGLLFALAKNSLTICFVSSNTESLIGVSPRELIGTSLRALCRREEDLEQFDSLASEFAAAKPTYLFTVMLGTRDTKWDAIVHSQGDFVVVEFEPSSNASGIDASHLYRQLQSSLVQLENAKSVLEMSEVCAEQVSKLTGFDRVMVYRFDAEWNGEVIAERKRDDLETFLGLHYPASDIPKQARELYTKNWLRFITTIDYVPATLLADPGLGEDLILDQSFSVLRSVSPIHLEYLRNMGVGASMSISIIRQGRLWGLIACHHYSPRYVPYDRRKASELLGHFMSLHFAGTEELEFQEFRSQMKSTSSILLHKLETAQDPFAALLETTPNLLNLVDCHGAALVKEKECFRIGHTPAEDEIQSLADWLLSRPDNHFETDRLQQFYGGAVLAAVAAGVLAVIVSRRQRFILFWFRPEQVQVVNWAGNPGKMVDPSQPLRLSPRGSFALWSETVRGRSSPWTEDELTSCTAFRDSVVQLMIRRAEEIAAAADNMRLASLEREKALESERSARLEVERISQMKDEFVATLSHELRTPLNAILGWTQILQILPGETPREIKDGLAVIERNARAQSVMIEDLLEMSSIVSGKIRLDLLDVDFRELVLSAIESVAPIALSKGVRLEKLIDSIYNAQTTADPNRLKQVIWNLLTNAVKFTPKNGKVQVVLRKIDSHMELSVIDTGIGVAPDLLPHIFDRYRQADSSTSRKYGGLGLGLAIVRTLVELHGGTVSAYSRGEGSGSRFVVTLPFVSVQKDNDVATSDDKQEPATKVSLLQGLRVLTVDDETDSREMLARFLTAYGCVVQSADSATAALILQQNHDFDVIVSDVGMPQMDGYEFMRAWRASEVVRNRPRIPAIALTAYARSEDRRRALLAGFQSHVTKPIEIGELVAVVASLAGRV